MSQPTMPVSPLTESSVTLKDLPLSAIHVADNYRSAINSEGLEALAASIVAGGLIQPVTVRPLDEPIEGRTHALVAGFRRFAAHELAGLPTILATVRELTSQMAEAIRLAENIMRENPHPADEALAVGKLSREGMNTEAIASYLGKNPRWVSQRRAISELLPEWLKDLREDKLTLGGAEELSRWPAEVQRRCWSQRGSYVVTEAGVRSWVSREKQQLGSAPWPLEDATLYHSA